MKTCLSDTKLVRKSCIAGFFYTLHYSSNMSGFTLELIDARELFNIVNEMKSGYN